MTRDMEHTEPPYLEEETIVVIRRYNPKFGTKEGACAATTTTGTLILMKTWHQSAVSTATAAGLLKGSVNDQ